MCVKCRLDGELPVGRKVELLAVHISHPAAAHDRDIPAMRGEGLLQRRYFFMKQMKQQFVDSWHELKHLKTIVVTAMFIAIGVVLGFYFSIQITSSVRIGFSFIANEMTALLFGPVVGGIMGGVTDIIKYLLKPMGAFSPGLTFNAIFGAVIYGVMFYKHPISFKRILAAKVIVAIVVNLCLGTFWLQFIIGKGFWVLLPARAVKQLIVVPIESVIFYIIAKTLAKTKVISTIKAKH